MPYSQVQSTIHIADLPAREHREQRREEHLQVRQDQLQTVSLAAQYCTALQG